MIKEGTIIPDIRSPNLTEYQKTLDLVEESNVKKSEDKAVDQIVEDKLKERDHQEYMDMIFKYQWIIKTWIKYTLLPEEYKEKGMIVSGDLQHDLEMMDSETTTTRSIAQLAEMLYNGYEFIIVNFNDMEKIFSYIQEYTAYVGKKLSNTLYFQMQSELSDSVKELLEDVVKLQNLGNKIFPAMINLNREYVQHTSGLLGFLQHDSYINGSKLAFDPALKYGITLKEFNQSENRDKVTGDYNAIDLSQHFNPAHFEHMRGIV